MAKPSQRKTKNEPQQVTQRAVDPVVEITPLPGRRFLPGVIFLLTLVPFLPVLQNEFVNWDDDRNIVENPYYRGLGWPQIGWMFSTFHLGHYQPLSWLSLGLDYVFWGMEPFGYHLTSLLLHGANAVLFYFATLKLFEVSFSIKDKGFALNIAAIAAALIFSIHPLRVESVAWTTERRDVLSGFFLLGSILFYFRALREGAGRKWCFTAAVFCYAFSLLSKASGVTLPIVLLVLDIYPLRRLTGAPIGWFSTEHRKVWLEKLPFFVLAVAAGIVALMAQHSTGTVRTLAEHGLVSRFVQALYGLAFYLWKTIVPLGLSPLYELPRHLEAWSWYFLLGGLGTGVITLFLVLTWRKWPAGLTAWVCYGTLLAPILGVAQSGVQLVADRYSYLACLSWAVLMAAAVAWFLNRWRSGQLNRWIFVSMNGALATILLSMGLLTWKQTQIWRDSETLWRHVLKIDPNASIAYLNLGQDLARRGRASEAMEYFQRSLSLKPDGLFAHLNLGRLLALAGKTDEAIEHFQKAVRSNPRFAEGHNELGNALLKANKLQEAIVHYRLALQIDPKYEIASNNLANALVQSDQVGEAIKQLHYSLQINPTSADTYYNLAKIHARTGDLASAVLHYQAALKINSNDAEGHNELGVILAQQGKIDEAMAHFRDALAAKPDFVDAYLNLGRGEAAQGNLPRAAQYLRQALQMDPEFAPAHENLARVLVLQGKKPEAAKHYQEALRILRSQSEVKAGG